VFRHSGCLGDGHISSGRGRAKEAGSPNTSNASSGATNWRSRHWVRDCRGTGDGIGASPDLQDIILGGVEVGAGKGDLIIGEVVYHIRTAQERISQDCCAASCGNNTENAGPLAVSEVNIANIDDHLFDAHVNRGG